MDVNKVIELYPRLYHMAERGTWPSIQKHGLMSARAVLERSSLNSEDRQKIDSTQRSSKIAVPMGKASEIVLRDQIPMPENRLSKALDSSTSPEDWYQLINSKVFFWTSEERLHRLLKARHYRGLEHDVLTVDTASLMSKHQEDVWLCHMNSGNTFPIPHERGLSTFLRIADYPVNSKGKPLKQVVELVVDYEVRDIKEHVVDVRKMRGQEL